MERLGIVGLPNAGKSTLFNALTGGDAVVAPHPFSTTESTVGIATVHDERVERLGEMSKSKKLVFTGFETIDIAALVKGANTGQGMGNRFLGTLREVDALLFVLRAFVDENVPGDTDPADDLADARARARGGRPRPADRPRGAAPQGLPHRQVARRRGRGLEQVLPHLEQGTPLYRAGLLRRRARRRPQGLPADGEADDRGGQHRRRPARRGRRLVAAVRRGRRGRLRAARDGGVAPRRSRSGPSCWRASASARACCPASPARPTTSSAAARSSPPATRSRGRGPSGPAPRPPSAPASSTPTSSAASSGRRSSAGTSSSSIGSWAKAKEVGKIRVEGKDYEVSDGDVMEIRFNV